MHDNIKYEITYVGIVNIWQGKLRLIDRDGSIKYYLGL